MKRKTKHISSLVKQVIGRIDSGAEIILFMGQGLVEQKELILIRIF